MMTENGTTATADTIAKAQNLSVFYTHNILKILEKSGFIITIRGAKGGYKLLCDPKNTNVYQIIESLEDTLNLVDCTANPDFCVLHDKCGVNDLWKDLQLTIRHQLESVSLDSLLQNHQTKQSL
jgi:Rrf2 family protein